MIPRIYTPFLLVLALCLPHLAQAEAPKVKPRASPAHHHTVIESVSADSITIKQSDGSHTYKINSNTEITFKGQTTTADKLETGMRVQVTPDGADAAIAAQIAADDPPKDPSPKPSK